MSITCSANDSMDSESIHCSLPKSGEWEGVGIEAVFTCELPGTRGRVVTKGYGQDYYPEAVKTARNQAIELAKGLCYSDIRLIDEDEDRLWCLEGVCSVYIRALFECQTL